jgi:hypothetical protein
MYASLRSGVSSPRPRARRFSSPKYREGKFSESRIQDRAQKTARRILKIKRKNKSDYKDDDLEHMKRVNGYVKRHLGQGPNTDVEDSNWRYSLMNWGHDPLK